MSSASILITIKVAHTVVWALMVACIVAMPLAALRRRFDWVLRLTLVIVVECVVLAFNGMRCPLTDLAARYVSPPAISTLPANFDIYLPNWIALHNKEIFGILFAANLLFALYWRRRQAKVA
jgi:hypothetical protein